MNHPDDPGGQEAKYIAEDMRLHPEKWQAVFQIWAGMGIAPPSQEGKDGPKISPGTSSDIP